MPITFDCAGCGKNYVFINENLAGRRGTCSACGAKFVVPGTATSSSATEPPSAPSTGQTGLEEPVFLDVEDDSRSMGPAPLIAAIAGGVGLLGLLLVGGVVALRANRATPQVESAQVGLVLDRPAVVAPPTPPVVASPTATTTTIPEPSTSPDPAQSGSTPEIPAPPPAVVAATPLTTEQIIARSDASVGVVRGPTSSGTGFLVAPGLLATNAHVIRRTPPNAIKVHFPSAPARDRGPFPIKVVYFDDERDLAILSVASKLEPLTVRGDHQFRRGQEVLFIGSPGLGGTMILENVASRGILGSRVKLDDLDYYQLSGSVNGGNSGGPIIDMEGHVIGVVTARASKEEGLGFCVPAADLAAAVKIASSGNLGLQAEASQRHEAAAKLATMRVVRQPGPAPKGKAQPQDDQASEFLRKTEPATWLASVDSNQVLKDTSPRIIPFRARLKKADTIYLEDERVIAALLIQAVMKVRETGLPLSCALLLDSSLNWAPDSYLRGSTARSFQEFTENYCDFRINERLDHKATILRMQSTLAKPQTAAQDRPPATKATDKGATASPSSASSKPAPRKANPESPSGRFETARSLEDGGNTQAAIFAYEALIEKFPLTSQADEAKIRLKKLQEP